MRDCAWLVVPIALALTGHAAPAAEGDGLYRVAPGDTLQVTVLGAPDIPAGAATVTVRPDGAIMFPYAGEQQVGGKTVAQVTEALATALAQRYQHINVTINLVRSHAREAFVVGQVVRPGPVPIDGETLDVAEALGGVGGPTADASLTGAQIYRQGQPVRTVDLTKAMTESAAGIALAVNDVLVVMQKNQIAIVGEVTRTGIYSIPADARISTLAALAGTFTANADRRRAVLIDEKGQTTVVDLQALLRSPDSPQNMAAAGFRTLVIPPKTDVVVVGEVTTPGTYKAAVGSRLTELIAAAGGLLPTADAGNILVMDENGATRRLDATEAAAHPESEANAVVGSASLIVVGRGRNEIPVLGEVVKPSTIPAPSPMKLSNLLAQAGGLTTAADPHRVQIIRAKGASEIVDATNLVGQAAPGAEAAQGTDPLLYPGDSVIANRRYARVVVLGVVRNPGAYEFSEGDTVVNAVALAGGLDRKAIAKETSIIRRKGDVVQVISLDVKAELRGDNKLLPAPLQDRDIVYVPVGRSPVWGGIVAAVLGVGTFVRLFIR